MRMENTTFVVLYFLLRVPLNTYGDKHSNTNITIVCSLLCKFCCMTTCTVDPFSFKSISNFSSSQLSSPHFTCRVHQELVTTLFLCIDQTKKSWFSINTVLHSLAAQEEITAPLIGSQKYSISIYLALESQFQTVNWVFLWLMTSGLNSLNRLPIKCTLFRNVDQCRRLQDIASL